MIKLGVHHQTPVWNKIGVYEIGPEYIRKCHEDVAQKPMFDSHYITFCLSAHIYVLLDSPLQQIN